MARFLVSDVFVSSSLLQEKQRLSLLLSPVQELSSLVHSRTVTVELRDDSRSEIQSPRLCRLED